MVTPSPGTETVARLAREEWALFLRARELKDGDPYFSMKKTTVHTHLDRYDGLCLALAHLLVADGVLVPPEDTGLESLDGANWLLGRSPDWEL